MESSTLLREEDTQEKSSNNQDGDKLKEVRDTRRIHYRKWFVLTAGFFTCALAIGFPFNMSVLYVEWLDEFKRSNSETALVQSFCTGVILIGGFASGFAITKYGPRRCGIFGGVIAAIGLTSSYFATNILYLVLLIGLISGLGLSVCYISASTCVGSHFNGKSKMLALSFTEFGAGVGSSAIPIVLETMIEEYGWRGTLLLIGGIMFNFVVFASLFRFPTDYYDRDNVKIRINRDLMDYETDNHHIKMEREESTDLEFHHTNQLESELPFKQRASLSKLYKTLKALLHNRTFLLYSFSIGVGMSAYNSILIFLIDFLQSAGIARKSAVLIYLYMNIADTVTRLLLGFIKQIPHVSVLFLSVVGALFGCIATVVFPFVGASYSLILITCLGFRIGYATMITALPMSIVKLVAQEDYSAGLGLTMTAIGIFQTIAGPISGYIRDVTGNYDASFFSASAALLVSAVVLCTTMIYRYYQDHNKHRHLSVNAEPVDQYQGDV